MNVHKRVLRARVSLPSITNIRGSNPQGNISRLSKTFLCSSPVQVSLALCGVKASLTMPTLCFEAKMTLPAWHTPMVHCKLSNTRAHNLCSTSQFDKPPQRPRCPSLGQCTPACAPLTTSTEFPVLSSLLKRYTSTGPPLVQLHHPTRKT